MSMVIYIDPLLLTKSPLVIIGLAFSVVGFFMCLYGVCFFGFQGLRKRFTRAIIFLVLINAIGLLMQVSEVCFVYLLSYTELYTWRNIMFELCMISLNMLQLEIFSCFNGGLLHISLFHAENIKWLRLASIILHLITGLGAYLEGIAWQYSMGSILSLWTGLGPVVYAVFICIIGVTQNLLILKKVKQHIRTITVSNGSADPRVIKVQGTKILIYFVLALDLSSLAIFIISGVVGSLDNYIPHYSLMQICFGIFGIHMFLETFLFERIVDQFRKKVTSPVNSKGSRAVVSNSGVSSNPGIKYSNAVTSNTSVVPLMVSPNTPVKSSAVDAL
ncbi:hypothetical protein O5D80_000699 [Batrachochytrium dendrobatidis]|nr:hypothetical protein O5D80_000699 [Batrachochytrium dendrobatidis]